MSEPIDYSDDFDIDDFADGKVMAILAYIPAICCCANFISIGLAFAKKDNDFHAFHARQGLGLFLLGLAVFVPLGVLGQVFGMMGIAILLYLIAAVNFALFLGFAVLCVMGILNATKQEFKTLPLVGDKFVGWFGFLKKEDK